MKRGGIMGFEDVIDMVLSLMTEYGLASESGYEDFVSDMAIRINMVIARAQIPELSYDTNFEGLNRTVTVMEATIIAYGLLMMWLSPKVNNSEVLGAQLTSKEITSFSNANRIQQIMSLYKLVKTEFYQMVIDYDFLQQKAEVMKDLED